MKAERMRRIETNFAAAVARVPLDEPLGEGLVRRAEISGLRRIVARDGPLAAEARIELDRREGADRGRGALEAGGVSTSSQRGEGAR